MEKIGLNCGHDFLCSLFLFYDYNLWLTVDGTSVSVASTLSFDVNVTHKLKCFCESWTGDWFTRQKSCSDRSQRKIGNLH